MATALDTKARRDFLVRVSFQPFYGPLIFCGTSHYVGLPVYVALLITFGFMAAAWLCAAWLPSSWKHPKISMTAYYITTVLMNIAFIIIASLFLRSVASYLALLVATLALNTLLVALLKHPANQ